MLVSAVMEKTIVISAGSLHDTDHFLKAYALAKTIAETDGLDTRTQELAAVVHDIACPLCCENYGTKQIFSSTPTKAGIGERL